MASELSEKQIQEIIKGYVREALNDDENDRINETPLTPEKLDDNLSTYDYLLSDFREALALRDNRPVKKFVNTILEEMNIKVDEDSSSYRKLCRQMLKAQVDVLEKLKKRELGDYSGEYDQGLKPQESIETAPSITRSSGSSGCAMGKPHVCGKLLAI